MSQTVIIINGSGESGKDTICDIVANHYNVLNISSIDPIKSLAKTIGWNGEKDDVSRKFLSDLKKITTEYNDYSNNYLLFHFKHFFYNTKREIMFVHIREPEEIEKFKKSISDYPIKVRTLLIKREENKWNNSSDANVENYKYNFVYNNNTSLEDLEKSIMPLIEYIITE